MAKGVLLYATASFGVNPAGVVNWTTEEQEPGECDDVNAWEVRAAVAKAARVQDHTSYIGLFHSQQKYVRGAKHQGSIDFSCLLFLHI